MADTPSSFFFPTTTAPVYAPTTNFSPFGFGEPPYVTDHHPSPFFYPSSTQIHGGLYPPPLYPGGYGSVPPTHPYPVPFLPHPCYQIHAPPAESTPPPTTVPQTTVQHTTHPLLPASDFSPPPPLAPNPPAPTREHPQPHPALHTSASKVAAAQAQAQAAEEEQIRARLPREVLNTNRRLDHLQHSFDLLQSHASRLKEMVAQIGAALGKQPAPGTAPNSPAPSPKPATTTQSAASVSNEFYGVLSLQSSLCGRPKQQHKEGGSGSDLTMGTNTSGTSINGKKLVHKQPGLEILSMGHAGSTYHFSPAPSPVLDLDMSYGRQPAFQQGATSGSPALHVFDEMPTRGSGYENYCYGHPNPAQSSCMHGGSTNLTEQHIDGMPQSYGFHNLNRQSIFLADETEHSYFSLPAEYPLEYSTPRMPSSATANVPMNVQDAPNVSAKMPVYDVYEEDATACWSCIHPTVDITEAVTKQVEVKADSGKPIISPEIPTDGVYSFTNEKKPDNELIFLCVKKASDDTFSEETTEFTFSHGPAVYADRFIKLKNEKSTQATSTLCVHEVIVHCHDERPEHINCTKGLSWELVAPPSHSINHAKLRLLWDPGTSASFHSSKVILVDLLLYYFQGYGAENKQTVHWDPGIGISSSMSSADMLNYTFKQQQQNDKKASANVQQRRDPQLNALVIHVRRKEWDPGASLPLMLRFSSLAKSVWWQWYLLHLGSGYSNGIHIPLVSAGHSKRYFICKHYCQTIQKNYNASNLLSSHSYLHIWEMDIIYITFLPP